MIMVHEDSDNDNALCLEVDGELYHDTDGILITGHGPASSQLFEVKVSNKDIARKLMDHRWSEIVGPISGITIPILFSGNLLGNFHLFSISGKFDPRYVRIDIPAGSSEWPYKWKPSDYYEVLSDINIGNDNVTINFSARPVTIIMVDDSLYTDNGSRNSNYRRGRVKNSLSRIYARLLALHLEVVNHLEKAQAEQGGNSSVRSVATHFDFPEPVRVPCEQYLLYFVEFLKDAGVSAAADLKHDAGRVLFTVTPDNPDEGLEKIRAALDVYLHLPSTPSLIQTPTYGESFEVQRLIAELQGFHMRLSYANMQLQAQAAVLEAKDATIQAKDATILNLSTQLRDSTFTPITAEVFVDSVRAIESVRSDKSIEPVLGKVIDVAIYRGPGFNINLPEVVRWTKRLFKKGDGPDSPDSKLLPPGQ